MPVCVSDSLSVCLSVCLSIYMPVCLSVCLSICLSICLFIGVSVNLSVCLSVYLPVCVCVSVCLPVNRLIHKFTVDSIWLNEVTEGSYAWCYIIKYSMFLWLFIGWWLAIMMLFDCLIFFVKNHGSNFFLLSLSIFLKLSTFFSFFSFSSFLFSPSFSLLSSIFQI